MTSQSTTNASRTRVTISDMKLSTALTLLFLIVCGSGATEGDPIHLYDLQDYQIIQVYDSATHTPGGDSADWYFRGTMHRDSLDSIVVRIIVSDSSDTIVSVRADTLGVYWWAKIRIPRGGEYLYRTFISGFDGGSNDHNLVGNRFGVGEVIGIAGQSNASGYGTLDSTRDSAGVNAAMCVNGTWGPLIDPTVTPNGYASLCPRLADTLIARRGCPIGVVNVGYPSSILYFRTGGSVVSSWKTRIPDFPMNLKNLHGSILQQIGKAQSLVRAMIWVQGEAETDTTQGCGYQMYRDTLVQLIEDWRADLYSTLPVFIGVLGRYTGASAVKTDSSQAYVTRAQLATVNDSDVFVGAVEYDLPLKADGAHITTEGIDTLGVRLARVIDAYLDSTIYTGYRGPVLLSMDTTDDSTIRTTWKMTGSAVLVDANYTAFTVKKSNGDTITIDSFTVGTNTVDLHLAEAVASGTTFEYAYGKGPDITTVLEDDAGRSAEPYPFKATIPADSLTPDPCPYAVPPATDTIRFGSRPGQIGGNLKDTYFRKSVSNTSYGKSTGLEIGGSAAHDRIALLRFDIENQIDSSFLPMKAKLRVYLSSAGSPSDDVKLRVYPLTTDWGINKYHVGTSSATAETGEPTYGYPFFSSVRWAGGSVITVADCDTVPLKQLSVSTSDSANIAYEVDVTDIVETWFATDSLNFGFAIFGGSGSEVLAQISSMENPNMFIRPELLVYKNTFDSGIYKRLISRHRIYEMPIYKSRIMNQGDDF